MKCIRCGYDNKETVKYCESCGAPFMKNILVGYRVEQSKPYNSFQPQNQPIKKKGLSTGATLAIIFGSLALAAVVLFVLFTGVGSADFISNNISSDIESSTVDPVTFAKRKQESEWYNYYNERKDDYLSISANELHDNDKKYENKYIHTAVKITNLKEDSFCVSVQHDNSIFYGLEFEFKQYSNELQYYKNSEYVTVIGHYDKNVTSWSDVLLTDCHIIDSGANSRELAVKLSEKNYEEMTIPETTSAADIAKAESEKKWSDEYKKIDAVEVDISELHDNVAKYEGKTILTVAKIDSMDNDSFKTETQHDKSFFYGVEFEFKQYDGALENYKKGDYLILYGTVNKNNSSWSDVCVSDCHIIGSGQAALDKAKELNK